MINLETIEREINELENKRDTTYAVCERLCWLYTVRDHIRPRTQDETTHDMKGSEFLELSSGVSYPALMEILDEHVQTLSVVQPRAYESLMRRIRELR